MICKRSVRRYLMFLFIFCGLQTQTHAQEVDEQLVCRFLDDFSMTTELTEPFFMSSVSPEQVTILDNGAPGVLGDVRHMRLGPLTGAATIFQLSNGTFSIGNTAGSSSPATLLYDANGAGLDLNLSAAIALVITLQVSDHIGSSARITLVDSNNNSAEFFIPELPSIIGGDTFPNQIDALIEDFSGIEALDLSEIFSIQFDFLPAPQGADLAVNDLIFCDLLAPPTAIPTLSRWGLLAMAMVLGMFGLLVLRRQ